MELIITFKIFKIKEKNKMEGPVSRIKMLVQVWSSLSSTKKAMTSQCDKPIERDKEKRRVWLVSEW